VLIVDDNRDAADSLALLLQFSGYDVHTAHDGLSALKAMDDYRPAVVLLDIGMPGMNGYEVARRVRERPELRDILLVALTGWGQEEDRRRSAEAGFDRHLVKPVDPEVLQGLLASFGQPRTEPRWRVRKKSVPSHRFLDAYLRRFGKACATSGSSTIAFR
jgi:CheY-like chemotaxis protein